MRDIKGLITADEKSIITTEEGRRRGGEDGFIEPGDSGPIYIERDV